MMAVKNAPGSSPGSMSSPTMRTCAEDEIGRNSVSACTIPSTAATSQSYIRLLENVGWEQNHGSRRIGKPQETWNTNDSAPPAWNSATWASEPSNGGTGSMLGPPNDSSMSTAVQVGTSSNFPAPVIPRPR